MNFSMGASFFLIVFYKLLWEASFDLATLLIEEERFFEASDTVLSLSLARKTQSTFVWTLEVDYRRRRSLILSVRNWQK